MFNRKISLRLHISVLLAITVWVAIIFLTVINHYRYKTHLTEVAQQSLSDVSKVVELKIFNFMNPAVSLAKNIINDSESAVYQTNLPLKDRVHKLHSLIRFGLIENQQFSSIFVGYENGSFVSMRRPKEETIQRIGIPRSHIKSVSEGLFLIDREQADDYKYSWHYLLDKEWIDGMNSPDQKLKEYDPRKRTWYKLAKDKKQPVWSDIYQFAFSGGKLGITYAVPFFNEKKQLIGVLGIDIELPNLMEYFKSIKFSPTSFLFCLTDKGNLLAHSKVDLDNIKKYPVPLVTHHMYDNEDQILVSAIKEDNKPQIVNYEDKELLGMTLMLPKSLYLDTKLYLGAELHDFTKIADQVLITNIWIGFFSGLAMLIVVSLVSKQISHPVREIIDNINDIRALKFKDMELKPIHIIEIEELNKAVYLMNNSLQSFARFVPTELVADLMKQGDLLTNGGKKCEITLMFSDIANFTTISEQSDEEVLFDHLTEYFTTVCDIIIAHGGVIDKFIGDAVMAFWGAPTENEQQSEQACLAVLKCHEAIQELNERWIKQGKQPFYTRIGVHRGIAFVGNVGSKKRISYTALGNTVNVASRLEGLNKQENTHILVSESVVEHAQNNFNFREIGFRSVKGKHEEVKVYELISIKASENNNNNNNS